MHAKQNTTQAGHATKTAPGLGYQRSVRLTDTAAAAALERTKSAFGQEGFGVVAEIDFRDTLRRKLDKDIGPYWVLEICNPSLAHRALTIQPEAGLFMPCKVAVWREGKDAVVSALRPEIAVGFLDVEALSAIAREAERHIERALVRLEAPDREPAPATADEI